MSEQVIESASLTSSAGTRRGLSLSNLVTGFVAGAVAVLLFHQSLLALIAAVGFVPAKAYATDPTVPFGVPQVLSAAFWGGVWGVVFAWVQSRFPRGAGYWIAALVFGAIFPSLVAWFVAAPLKGLPIAAGGDVHRIVTALVANGAWGIGTALLYWLGRGGLRPKWRPAA